MSTHEQVFGLPVQQAANLLAEGTGISPVFPRSFLIHERLVGAIGGRGQDRKLIVTEIGQAQLEPFSGVQGEFSPSSAGKPLSYRVCAQDGPNAFAALARFPSLQLGTLPADHPSLGLGDRFGICTPIELETIMGLGYLDSFRVITGQMSAREMLRVEKGYRRGLGPADVMARALFGGMRVGYPYPTVVDADHMQDLEWMTRFIKEGHATFITLDLIKQVRGSSEIRNRQEQVESEVDWQGIGTTWADAKRTYVGKFHSATEEQVADFYIQYGAALAHVVKMISSAYELAAYPIQFEISTDELNELTPSMFIGLMFKELQRLIPEYVEEIVSVAPRFDAIFEKAVNVQGSLKKLEAYCVELAGILKEFPWVRVSVHSGSDKYQAYAVIAKVFCGNIHVKTAGVWGLAILRAISNLQPGLFRQIVQMIEADDYAIHREEAASYHQSVDYGKLHSIASYHEHQYMLLMDDAWFRQLLHIPYGVIFDRFGQEIDAFLVSEEEAVEQYFLAPEVAKHVSIMKLALQFAAAA